MKYESFFRCDLCNQKFDTGRGVRNDIALLNGTHSRVYGDVCDECVAKLARMIDDKFPNNRVLKNKEESLATVSV
jgi:hypothetical protein